jgi:hypothetical protein
LRAPSEAHFPLEATTRSTKDEGRWERDGNHQKKAMKTTSSKSKSAPGLRVQSSNHQSPTTDSVAPAPVQTPAATPERPRIDFARRRANRELPTDQLLSLLRTKAPRFFELAEVVGRWVWIQFPDRQPPTITAQLAEFGFHWNNKRQVWQHPCGPIETDASPADPRAKYGARHAADLQPA